MRPHPAARRADIALIELGRNPFAGCGHAAALAIGC
jgi:hypothetical protein